MPDFPSVEWFQQAADLLNKSDAFKQFGTVDTEMGVQVGDRFFEIDFEAFEVKRVSETDERRMDELDFYLVQSPDAWKAMLDDIKANGHDFLVVDLASSAPVGNPPEKQRILAAILDENGNSWIIQMTGEEAAVASQKNAFLNFIRSLKIP